MKKKAAKRPAKATSRQSTLNFPTSSEADLVAESTPAVTSTKSGAKNRRQRTADFADDTDKHNESHRDSSAVKNCGTDPNQENAPLPNGWRWMKAREVGEINLGRQRSPKHLSADFPTKYLRAANITETGLDLSDVLEMDFKPAEKERYQLRHGDILISEASGSAAQVGKPAIWNDELPMCCFQNTVIRLRPDAVSSKYLLWLFTHFYRNGVFARVAGGVGINHLSASKFSELSLPIAPPAEQRRIVAEIEKQFTRLDAGVAALKRVQANLKRYRAAVLKAACEGKLVPTEAELRRTADYADIADKKMRLSASSAKSAVKTPPFETGEQLLQRILAERRQNWQGRGQYKEPAEPDSLMLPALPGGWTWATFDQLTTLITKGSSPNWQGFNYCDEGIMFVRSENVRWGTLNLQGVAYLPPAFNEKETKSVLREGDVLLNLVGASIGRAAIATDEVEGGNVNQAVAVIRLVSKKTMNQFAMLWLNSSNAQKRIHENKVDVARANFGLDDTRVLPIPLPPLAEQSRIVAEVERRLSVVDELEAVVSANLQRAARLRQSILQKAFTGGL